MTNSQLRDSVGVTPTSPLADRINYDVIVCFLYSRVKMMIIIANTETSKVEFPARSNNPSPIHGIKNINVIHSQSIFDFALPARYNNGTIANEKS